MSFIIFLSLLVFILNIKDESMIIFPFKAISLSLLGKQNKEQYKENSYDCYNFFNEHFIIRMFTTLKIGSPPQDIITFLNIDNDNLLIGELPEIPNNIFSDSFYKGYQYNKSSSFNNITGQIIIDSYNKKISIGEENICLFKKISDIKRNDYTCFEHFKFKVENQIKFNSNPLYGLIIGLSLDEKNSETNFMRQIKERGIISSSIYSFEYINDIEGRLIIGKYPHEYEPEKYKKEKFKTLYPDNPSMSRFNIYFDEVYIIINNEKIYVEKNVKSNLLPNLGLIVGTDEYLKFIENTFFNQLIDSNICQKKYVGSGWVDYIMFSCDNTDNFNIEKFHNLFFHIKSNNLTFDFSYNELFKQIFNKYYFLIVFESFGNGIWRFGKPFLEKFVFTYNGDSKQIGFYENEKDTKTIKVDDRKKYRFEMSSLKIFFIIILFIIFIALVIFISYCFGKKCNLLRKKLANELDDNFEYVSYSNNKYKLYSKDINERDSEIKGSQNLELRDESKFNV